MKAALLPDRGVVKVAGADARTFLNGLLTTDIAKVTPEQARFGALLTPQGKIIVDFLVVEALPEDGSGFFLDCPKPLVQPLGKHEGNGLLPVHYLRQFCCRNLEQLRRRCHGKLLLKQGFFQQADDVGAGQTPILRGFGALLVVKNQRGEYFKFIAQVFIGRVVGIRSQQLIEPVLGLRQLGLGADGRNGGNGLEG